MKEWRVLDMNFDLTDEQQMVRKLVREFAEAEVAPGR